MPRLFVEGQRYEAISSTALHEVEFQNLILQNADALFPGLKVVPFTKTIYHQGTGHAADLAVIAPDYSRWWVIEVELAHHSLENHVLPQVSTFAQGFYGRPEAEWLAQRDPQLDLTALERMMLGVPPRVVVVVNAMKSGWVTHLQPWAEMMVVELFRSDKDRFIFRQNGIDLAAPGDEITRVHVDPMFPRMLLIESPAPLLERAEESLQIEYQGELTDWSIIRAADSVWLSPRRGGLTMTSRYLNLVEMPEDRLGLIPIDPPRPDLLNT